MIRSRFLAAALAASLTLLACAIVAPACNSSTTASQILPIGSPCTASAQCGTATPYYCDKDHPNGYCKKDCTLDADCPPEAICAHDGGVGACHKKCDTVADCRKAEGYICKPASMDTDTLATHAFCDVSDAAGDDAGMGADGAAPTDGAAPRDGTAGG